MEETSPFTSWKPGDSIELQDLFVYFSTKFEHLESPRSIAEACLPEQDIQLLLSWFSALYGKPRNWCERDWQEPLSNGQTASSREMFGTLFLILAAELCRERSSEDSVWPVVADMMKADRHSFSKLFVAGHPSELCKLAMVAGARRLKLRNLIDRSGTQEYFDTIKLQFGFTFSGAKARLSDWLDGFATPMAVRILLSNDPDFTDLGSNSFQFMWTTLAEVRRQRVPTAAAIDRLKSSPWIRPRWLEGLVELAAKNPRRQTSASVLVNRDFPQCDLVCEPILRWRYPSKPRLCLRLKEEAIVRAAADADSLIFAVDGRIVARWTAQSDEVWTGPRVIPCEPESAQERPNLKPKIISIDTEMGKPLLEVDLSEEIGSGEPLLLFDLRDGELIDPESFLEPQATYALIVDPDLSVEGANQFQSLPGRKAFHLTGAIVPTVTVTAAGALYWQPKAISRPKPESFQIVINSEGESAIDLGRSSYLRITGLPPDTTSAVLSIGRNTYDLRRAVTPGSDWITNCAISIGPRLALGEERIRLKFCFGNSSRTVTPKTQLRLKGIAVINVNENGHEPVFEWRLVDGKLPLSIAGGVGRAKLFTPIPQSQVFEGPKLVNSTLARTVNFCDLGGWGWPLAIKTQDGFSTILVNSLEDRGCVAVYVRELFGKPIHKLWLRNPIEPSARHRIDVWGSLDETPMSFTGDKIVAESQNRIWNIPDPGCITALSVSYDGACLGSYVDIEKIKTALERPSAALFRLLRWLKVPVLSLSLQNQMQRAVFKAPAAFVSGWTKNDTPEFCFRHTDGAEIVLRWFLWDYKEIREERLWMVAREISHPARPGSVEQLVSIAQIHPSLSYCLARVALRARTTIQMHDVLTQILRLPQSSTIQACSHALKALGYEVSSFVRMEPTVVAQMVSTYGDYLDDLGSGYRANQRVVRELGERTSGRTFISATLLLRAYEKGTI